MGGHFSSAIEASRKYDRTSFSISEKKAKTKEGEKLVSLGLDEIPRLENISVVHCHLKAVPATIVGFESLRDLDLSHNDLSSVPPLESLPHLADVDLSHNRLTEFPRTLASCPSLLHLNLSNNELRNLGKETFTSSKLEALLLRDNAFHDFPGTITTSAFSRSLVHLDLGGNGMTLLSRDVNRLESLEKLHLDHNRLSSLPNELCSLVKLQALVVSWNALLALPGDIGSLSALRMLELQHNQLSLLPATIGKMSELRMLKLNDNLLTTLPQQIGTLCNLSVLQVQENSLQALPSELSRCSRLRKLYAEFNEIEVLPDEFVALTNLIVLTLHNNHLAQLPRCLPYMRSLLRLGLGENPLPEDVLTFLRANGALALLRQGQRDGQSAMIGTIRRRSRGVGGSMRKGSRPVSMVLTGPGAASPPASARDPSRAKDSREDLAGLTVSSALRPTTKHRRGKSHSRKKNSTDMAEQAGAAILGITSMAAGGGRRSKSPRNKKEKSRARSEAASKLPSLTLTTTDGEDAPASRPPAHGKAELPPVVLPSSSPRVKRPPAIGKFKAMFDRLVDSQDYSPARRAELAKLPPAKKWELLAQHEGSTLDILANKGASKGKSKKGELSQTEWVDVLNGKPQYTQMRQLRSTVQLGDQSWNAKFIGVRGMEALGVSLVANLSKKRRRGQDDSIVVEGLLVLEHLVGEYTRSVLTCPQAIVAACMALHRNVRVVATVALRVLLDVLDVQVVGQPIVMEALEFVSGRTGLPRFHALVEILRESAKDPEDATQVALSALMAINALLGEEEDLMTRVAVRQEMLAQGLGDALAAFQAVDDALPLLSMQVEVFGDDMVMDKEELEVRFLESKSGSIRGLVSSFTGSSGPLVDGDDGGSVMRIVVLHTQLTEHVRVPITPSTTIEEVEAAIVARHPIPSQFAAEKFGLHAGRHRLSASLCVDDALSKADADAECSVAFRMCAWEVELERPDQPLSTSKKRRGGPKSTTLMPDETVGGALASALGLWGLSSSVQEDYALCCQQGSVRVPLSPASTLKQYANMIHTQGNRILLVRLPWALSVLTDTSPVAANASFAPGMRVAGVVAALKEDLLPTSQATAVYGLCLNGQWIPDEDALERWPAVRLHRVHLRMRPRDVRVRLPSGHEASATIEANESLIDVSARIARQHGLDPMVHALETSASRTPHGKAAMKLSDGVSRIRSRDVLVLRKVELVDPEHKDDAAASTALWDEPEGERYVRYEDTAEGGRLISAGTLNKLVAHLTSPTEIDTEYTQAFFLTYPSFANEDQLMDKLLERYRVPSSHESERERIQLRVCLIMRQWVAMSWHVLKFPTCALAERICKFVEEELKPGGGRYATMGDALLKAVRAPPSTHALPSASSEDSSSRRATLKSRMGDRMTLMDYPEEDIAQQLTLLAFQTYRKIQPKEFFGSGWTKESKHHLAPHIVRMIAHFNRTAGWVASLLVSQEKLRQRVKVMAKLVRVMRILKDEHNNYHTLMAMISGLGYSSISRLKWTRGKLSKRLVSVLDEAEALMAMTGSFKSYREALEAANPPCLPYLGVYLGDLTFIEDGNPDVVEGDLINFTKRRLVHGIIFTLRKYQDIPYSFAPIPSVQGFLASQPVMDEDELYARSLEIEPRGAPLKRIK